MFSTRWTPSASLSSQWRHSRAYALHRPLAMSNSWCQLADHPQEGGGGVAVTPPGLRGRVHCPRPCSRRMTWSRFKNSNALFRTPAIHTRVLYILFLVCRCTLGCSRRACSAALSAAVDALDSAVAGIVCQVGTTSVLYVTWNHMLPPTYRSACTVSKARAAPPQPLKQPLWVCHTPLASRLKH